LALSFITFNKTGVFMKVTLMMAITLDGKIARDDRHFPDWTGSEDKKLFVQITKSAGAIIMGSKTYDTIGRPLPGRKNIILTRNQARRSDHPDLVYTNDSPETVLEALAADGYTEVVLVGGSIINAMFARMNLISEIIITIAPRIFGTGVPLFADELDMQLELQSVETLGRNYVLLRYHVQR